ncbi:hypothetical protein [Rhizobium rhizogenes]|uniref:hypothetical protein n=1 Tax=Rhizobium rhizogenes TaxID=359 RepID=UPI001571D676|nr:hypothetical protein [Rhizobium rhizogenes]NTI74242.1 hypothetical protein [Rhizobium rhizogenes]
MFSKKLLFFIPIVLALPGCMARPSTPTPLTDRPAVERQVRKETTQTLKVAMRDLNSPFLDRTIRFDRDRIVFQPPKVGGPVSLKPRDVRGVEKFLDALEKANEEEKFKRDICTVAMCTDKNPNANMARTSQDEEQDRQRREKEAKETREKEQKEAVERSRAEKERVEKQTQEIQNRTLLKKLSDNVKEQQRQRHEACESYGYCD